MFPLIVMYTHLLVDAVGESNVCVEDTLYFARPPVAGVPRQADCLLQVDDFLHLDRKWDAFEQENSML